MANTQRFVFPTMHNQVVADTQRFVFPTLQIKKKKEKEKRIKLHFRQGLTVFDVNLQLGLLSSSSTVLHSHKL